jgi:hypothetical protein
MPNTVRLVMKSMLCICVLMALAAGSAYASSPEVHVAHIKAHAAAKDKQQMRFCSEAAPVRKAVIKKYGKRAPGRDICRYGVRGGSAPTAKQLSGYLQTLKRQIAPPPPVVVVATSPAAAASATGYSQVTSTKSYVPTSSLGTHSGSLPACASESGTNYSTGSSNTNPTSGATGLYQEMPEHRRPGGLCYGMSLSPQGQDECARVIYSHQGRSAWTNCGG